MSVRVVKHGERRLITNPANPEGPKQDVTPVTFEEIGNRGGANSDLKESSDLLSQAVGIEVGLTITRVHTQDVLTSELGRFTVGKEIPSLFITRTLHSVPQMQQQIGKPSRMVNGKPTYFTTKFSSSAQPDVDKRMSDEALLEINPNAFADTIVGGGMARVFAEQAADEGNFASSGLGSRAASPSAAGGMEKANA